MEEVLTLDYSSPAGSLLTFGQRKGFLMVWRFVWSKIKEDDVGSEPEVDVGE